MSGVILSMKTLALLLLLALPIPAFSANWTLLNASNVSELEIDTESVRDKKAAWFKQIYTPPQNICGYEKKEEEYEVFFVEARCKEFTIRVKNRTAYSPSNDVMDGCSFENSKAEFSEFVPETQGEVLFTAICNAKARVENRYAKNIRSKKVRDTFAVNTPCPITDANLKCEGYSIEYIIPPCFLGASADAVDNLKWVEKEGAAQYKRDQKKIWDCK